MNLVAKVAKDVADLVPDYLKNRRADVKHLRAAVAGGDFARLAAIAERLYASGMPFGFHQITTYGMLLRSAETDAAAIGEIVGQYAEYLERVEVVLVDAPRSTSIWRERRAEPRTSEPSAARVAPAPAAPTPAAPAIARRRVNTPSSESHVSSMA